MYGGVGQKAYYYVCTRKAKRGHENVEKGYVFIKWGRRDEPTLVASVDPNVDPKELLEHFDGFLDVFIFAY